MTRVGPLLTSEKVRTPGTLATVQVAPASVERYSPPGRVPAIISSGCSGSCAIAHTSCIGLATGSQRAVDSRQRNRPMSEPAHSTSSSDGWLAKHQTRASVYIPEWLFGWVQVSPRSALNQTEWPAVPAYRRMP